MDSDVQTCLLEFAEHVSVSTLQKHLPCMPAFLDSLRLSTCTRLREAFVKCATEVLREFETSTPDKTLRPELLKLQQVLEEAASFGDLLGREPIQALLASCTQTLASWRRHQAKESVVDILRAVTEHETFEEAKVIFMLSAEELSESLELVEWSDGVVSLAKGAVYLIVQIGAFVCDECACGETAELRPASLALSTSSKLGQAD